MMNQENMRGGGQNEDAWVENGAEKTEQHAAARKETAEVVMMTLYYPNHHLMILMDR